MRRALAPTLLSIAAQLVAQAVPATGDAATNELLRQQKLARPVFRASTWLTDFDRARTTAKQEQKLIFAYFTRSYVA